MEVNLVCNRTSGKQNQNYSTANSALHGRPILSITPMTADRVGLHTVLLPLQIGNKKKGKRKRRKEDRPK